MPLKKSGVDVLGWKQSRPSMSLEEGGRTRSEANVNPPGNCRVTDVALSVGQPCVRAASTRLCPAVRPRPSVVRVRSPSGDLVGKSRKKIELFCQDHIKRRGRME